MEVEDAIKDADICMILVPDELQADLYNDFLAQNLKEGSALLFAHGLAIHFQLIKPRNDLDVFMIAPKGSWTYCQGTISIRSRSTLFNSNSSRCLWKCT